MNLLKSVWSHPSSGPVRTALMTLLSLLLASDLFAQNGSIFHDPPPNLMTVSAVDPRLSNNRPAATPETGAIVSPMPAQSPYLAGASLTYQPPLPQRVLRVHDIVSIRVDEIARMTAEGRASQRKNGAYDAILKGWIEMEGLKAIRKAPQTAGDPEINGQMSQIYRANSDLQTRETLALNIAAEIADIRPNGNIVLEGHKSININDNRWEISVSGMCQAKDIGPGNLIMSKDIVDFKLDKRESGQARDGYRRGWFTEWASRLQPF